MSTATKDVAKKESSQYLVFSEEAKSLAETVKENVGSNGNMSVFDLDQVKVPAGGGVAWTVPSLKGDQEIRDLTGIIVAWHDGRSYWKEKFGGEGGPPDCASHDGVTGTGTPGGDCAQCPFAQFGSAPGNKPGELGPGQACKQMRTLLMIREKDILPVTIMVPPTSVGAIRKYFLRLSSHGLPYYRVYSTLTLAKAKSQSGIVYSTVEIAMSSELTPEEAAKISGIHQQFASILSGPVNAPSSSSN